MSGGSKFEDKRFGADELGDAITRSRALLPAAVDALCETITEVTGKAPSRERVEFVGTFWLMHICDRQVYGELQSINDQEVNPDPLWPNARSFRSMACGSIGKKRAPIRIVNPYLRVSPPEELRAAFKAHKQLRWQSVLRPNFTDVPIEREKRLQLAHRTSDPPSNSLSLARAIALTAPTDLVEQHHLLSRWAQARVDRNAKIIYSANAHQASTSFRHQLYEQRELSKIVIHQHGGGYGIDERHLGEEHDVSISDLFYTWGWDDPSSSGRTRPLPTALPMRDHDESSTAYLFMSLPVTTNFYRLQPFLIPEHVSASVNQSVDFMEGLAADVTLKVRSFSVGLFPLERLSTCAATLAVDPLKESGVSVASRAPLVIHNYLGTSWLETLAMNIPTVCFYDPAVFRPRESARPYFELLTRVGVLHHSGAAAARFVNDLRGDPASWWQKSEVQEARETFVARYANFKADWLPGWLQEFERLLAE